MVLSPSSTNQAPGAPLPQATHATQGFSTFRPVQGPSGGGSLVPLADVGVHTHPLCHGHTSGLAVPTRGWQKSPSFTQGPDSSSKTPSWEISRSDFLTTPHYVQPFYVTRAPRVITLEILISIITM